jgi:hypothetical protein
MIQSDKRWNIKLGSWICLSNLALWSLQAIVQIIRNGALSAPVISNRQDSRSLSLAQHSEHSRTRTSGYRCMEWSSLLPLPVVARMIIMGLH